MSIGLPDRLSSSRFQRFVGAPLGVALNLYSTYNAPSRQIVFMTAGSITYTDVSGNVITLPAVPAGVTLNVQARSIAAGNTSTFLILF